MSNPTKVSQNESKEIFKLLFDFGQENNRMT